MATSGTHNAAVVEELRRADKVRGRGRGRGRAIPWTRGEVDDENPREKIEVARTYLYVARSHTDARSSIPPVSLQDLVDALDVAAEVVRGLEASAEEDNKEAVERAIASFKEKVSGALRTYVKACNETCAGVGVPNRVTMGQGEGGESMGDEMKVD